MGERARSNGAGGGPSSQGLSTRDKAGKPGDVQSFLKDRAFDVLLSASAERQLQRLPPLRVLKEQAAALRSTYDQQHEADRAKALEELVDKYLAMALRLLHRDKFAQADKLTAGVAATLEKLGVSGGEVLAHSLKLQHLLVCLKSIKARAEAGVPGSDTSKFWEKGISQISASFPEIQRRRDSVTHFLLHLETLSFACYFAAKLGNLSLVSQFGASLRSLLDRHIKQLDSKDKGNLLVEVLVFAKKFQLPQERRIELYLLVLLGIVFYSCGLVASENIPKAVEFLKKGEALASVAFSENAILGMVKQLLVAGRLLQSNIAPRSAATYEVKVFTDLDQINQKELKEQEAVLAKQKAREDKAWRAKCSKAAFQNDLFMLGLNPEHVVRNDDKYTTDAWKFIEADADEASIKQTLEHTPAASVMLQRSKSEAGSRLHQFDENSNGLLRLATNKDQVEKDQASNMKKKEPLNRSATEIRRSGSAKLNSVSKPNSPSKTFGFPDKERMTDIGQANSNGNQEFLFFDHQEQSNHSTFQVGRKVKQLNMVGQLRALLTQADLREQMPDGTIFSTHGNSRLRPKKYSRWSQNDKSQTTAHTQGDSDQFTIDPSWFYGQMMAPRLLVDPNRVLTNDKTINMKNQQVMIEFKTGDHKEPSPPRQRPPEAYKQKSYLIKCSYEEPKKGLVRKGVPLGYMDHQVEERKELHRSLKIARKRPQTAQVSANQSQERTQTKKNLGKGSSKIDGQPEGKQAEAARNLDNSRSVPSLTSKRRGSAVNGSMLGLGSQHLQVGMPAGWEEAPLERPRESNLNTSILSKHRNLAEPPVDPSRVPEAGRKHGDEGSGSRHAPKEDGAYPQHRDDVAFCLSRCLLKNESKPNSAKKA